MRARVVLLAGLTLGAAALLAPVAAHAASWVAQNIWTAPDIARFVEFGPGRNDGTNRLYMPNNSITEGLHEATWTGSSWTVVAIGSGTTGWGVSAAAIGAGRNDATQRIYGVSGDSVYEYSWTGSTWTRTTLAIVSGNHPWVTVGPGRNDATNRIYAGHDNNNLYEYTWNGSTWPQTIIASEAGDINYVAVGNGRSDGVQRVYANVITPDNAVYEYTWSGSSWTKVTVGTVGGNVGIRIKDGRGDGIVRVYATSSDTHIYEFTYSGGAWVKADLGANPVTPGRCDMGIARHDGVTRLYSAQNTVGEIEWTYSAGWSTAAILSTGTWDTGVFTGRNDGVARVYMTGNPVYEITYDTVAPAAPTGLGSADAGTGGALRLSWTANTESDLKDYGVYRSTASGQVATAATRRTYIVAPGTTHYETGLTNSTTYYYRLTARDTALNESGGSVEASAYPIGSADTTPPTVTIVVPINGGNYNSLTTVSGTSNDPLPGAVNTVEIRIRHSGTGLYWNGSNFGSAGSVWLLATGTGVWTYASPAWASGIVYDVNARATDLAGNISLGLSTASFMYDTALPTATVTSPAHGTSLNALSTISGTAADAESGLALVKIRVRRNVDGYYWDGAGWAVGITSLAATGTSSWTYAGLASGNLTSGVSYYVEPWAYDAAGNFGNLPAPPGSSNFWFDNTPPTAPAGLGVADAGTGGALRLSWTANTEADLKDYRIRRSTATGITTATAVTAVVNAPGTTHQDTGLGNNTTYYYRLTARDTALNESAISAADVGMYPADTLAPAMPTWLGIRDASPTALNLSWTANTEGDLKDYRVYRTTAGDFTGEAVVAAILVPGTTHQDAGLTTGQNYSYRISARDTSGNESPQASTFPNGNPGTPNIPTGLNVTNTGAAGQGNRLTVAWYANAENDAYDYRIYRSTNAGVTQVSSHVVVTILVPGTTHLNHETGGLVNGTTYYYRLSVRDNVYNESGLSAEVSGVPQDGWAPAAPAGLGSAGATSAVNLSWTANTEGDLKDYGVYRATLSSTLTSKTLQKRIATPGTTNQDAVVFNGTTYYYQVTARDTSLNESGGSTEVSATPSGPPAVTWAFETVDSTGNVGGYSQIAIDTAGNTQIAYHDTTNLDARWAGQNGGGWTLETVDTPGHRGAYMGLALDAGGAPFLSYADITNGDLRFNQRSSPGSWPGEIVDSTGSVGNYTSIAVGGGQVVHIAYYDATNLDLKYAKRSSAGVWTVQTVDSAGDVGGDTGITLDGAGNPYIAYFDSTNSALKLAYWTGSAWTIQTVDATNNSGHYPRIVLSSTGTIHIVHWGVASADLRYAQWNGSSWSLSTIDTAGDVGRWPSIALDGNGNPHVSYYDNTNGDLKYARWTGTSWSLSTVDSVGNTGQYSSIAIGSDGNPRISYYDATNGDLRHARVTSGGGFPASVKTAWPTGVNAAVYTSSITWTWTDNAANEQGYRVRSATSDANLSGDLAVNAVSWTESGLPAGTYKRYVQVFNAGGVANSTAVVAAISDTTPPAVVSGLSASAGTGLVNLTWTANTEGDLQDYRIRHSTVSGISAATPVIATIVAPGTTHQDGGLVGNTTYFFRLSARDTSLNESGLSVEVSTRPAAAGDTTPPATPTGLTVTQPAQDRTLVMSWSANTEPDFSQYRLYKGTFSGTQASKTSIITVTVTGYTDGGLLDGTTYYFQLVAVDGSANASGPTAEVSGVTRGGVDTTPPAAISDLTALVGASDGQVGLTWTAPGDDGMTGTATTYELRRDTHQITTPADFAGAIVVTTASWVGGATPALAGTASSTTIVGLNPGVTYYFSMKAADEVGNWGSLAAPANNWAPAQNGFPNAPATPNGTSPGGGIINLYWTANTEADLTAYRIWRATSTGALGTKGFVRSVAASGTTHQDGGLTQSINYFYQLTARDTVGYESGGSGERSIFAGDLVAPSSPTALGATNPGLGGRLNLSWAANTESDLKDYQTWRSTFSSALSAKSSTTAIAAPGTTHQDAGLVNGTSYYYQLTARDTSGNESAGSPQSSAYPTGGADTTPPAAPAGLGAGNPGTSGRLNLSWTANTEGDLMDYRLYRCTESAVSLNVVKSSHSVAIVVAPGTTHQDIGLNNGTTYYYRVAARDTAGNESPLPATQAEASAYPTGGGDTTPPAAITNLAATTQAQVLLSWTAPSDNVGVTVYLIRYSSFAPIVNETDWAGAYAVLGPAPAPLAPGTTQTMVITGLKPRTTHYFAIKSQDAAGNLSALDTSSPEPSASAGSFVLAQEPAGATGPGTGGVAWGDYDNDGDLDVAVNGWVDGGWRFQVYRNDGGIFNLVQEPTGGAGPADGAVAWGDYDNDGDLDLVVNGYDGTGYRFRVYRNDGGTFNLAQEPAGSTGPGNGGGLAWGDFDNDGDLDLSVNGYDGTGYRFRVYRNDGGTLVLYQEPSGAVGPGDGATAWGDYDNDGDLDLVVAGWDGTAARFRVYRNDAGTFVLAQEPAGDPTGYQGAVAFGDYDNDGALDLAVSGRTTGGTNRFQVYRNNGGTFVLAQEWLGPGQYSSLAWGDFDNDGDLDLGVKGQDGTGTRFRIYRNDGGTFVLAQEPAGPTQAGEEGGLAWGDYDNDGDLDLAMNGRDGSVSWFRIYKSLEKDFGNFNSEPSAPAAISAVGAGTQITFTWALGTDAESPAYGRYYQIRVSTFSAGAGNKWVVSDKQGSPLLGNYLRSITTSPAQGRMILKGLTPFTTYYWSLRTIDTGLRAGAWGVWLGANTGSSGADTTPPAAPTGLIAQTPDDPASRGLLTLAWTANTEPDLSFYRVYRATFSGTVGTKAFIGTFGLGAGAPGDIDTGLADGTTYYYQVTVVDTSGNASAPSAEASGVTLGVQANRLSVAAPGTVTAGVTLISTVTAKDGGGVTIGSATDVVTLVTSDPYDSEAGYSGALSSGTRAFSVTLVTASTVTITASASGYTSGSTTTVVLAGPTTAFQVLLPGELAVPGKSPAGKTGTPVSQKSGVAFTATVNAVDAYWNVVSTAPTVTVVTSDPNDNDREPAAAALAAGTRGFLVAPVTLGYVTVTASAAAFTSGTSASVLITNATPPAAPSGLTATPQEGATIRLAWTVSTSADVTSYRIYYATATSLLNFAVPSATVAHPTSSYVTPVLTAGQTYSVVVRAVNASGNEETNANVVTAQALSTLAGAVRARVAWPLNGSRVAGARMTVIGEVVAGADRLASIRFDYRPETSSVWTVITPALAGFPNPDGTAPYFIPWDMRSLPLGNYRLRAVAVDKNGGLDPAAAEVSITHVAPADVDLEDTVTNRGERQVRQVVRRDQDNRVRVGDERGEVTEVRIPAGALVSTQTVVRIVLNPSDALPGQAGLNSLGRTRRISFEDGTRVLRSTFTVRVAFRQDAAGNIQGTRATPRALLYCRLNPATGRYQWVPITAIFNATRKRWEDAKGNEITPAATRNGAPVLASLAAAEPDTSVVEAETNQDGDYALFIGAAENLDLTLVYPNPFRPNSDATHTDITFANLTEESTIEVLTVAGERVWMKEKVVGRESWSGTNTEGEPVTTGVYVYIITSKEGQKSIGKLAVIR